MAALTRMGAAVTAIGVLCGAALGACGMLNGLDDFELVDRDRPTGATTGTGGAGGEGGSSTTTGGGMGGVGGGMGGAGGGSGECTGTDTSTCPPPSGECVAAVCNNDGTCGEMPLAAGTVTATQIDHDCKQNVCDANGNVTTENLDTDTEDDSESCTTDTCNAGNPVHTPVAPNTACSEGNGSFCSATGTCVECNNAGQCASNVCQGNACVPTACNDNVQNQGETDTDCGGPNCGPCNVGDTCLMGSDCDTLVCNTTCQAASCSDNVQNQNETDIDCGGPCGAICLVNDTCAVDGDCMTGYCDLTMVPHMCMVPDCMDGVQNQGETGVDCGIAACGLCNGDACTSNTECKSGMCYEGACVASVNSCNINTATDLTGVSATTVTFANGNFTYAPKCIKVKANPPTVVTFNGNFANHPTLGGILNSMNVEVPGSSGPFVPVTNTGITKDFTFDTPGTYPYYCVPHGTIGMNAAVFVVP